MTSRALLPALLCLLAGGPLAASAPMPPWGATQTAQLLPAAPTPGDDLGRGVSISGPWAAVGAPLEDAPGAGGGSTPRAGAVHLWRLDPGGWVLAQTLFAPSPEQDADFGYSVALAGDLLVVGAPDQDAAGVDSGSAFLYQLTGASWSFVAELTTSDSIPGADFGKGVGTDGATVLVGAPRIDIGGYALVGAVYVYILRNDAWVLEDKLVPAALQDFMQLGTAVDVDGDRLIAAARDAIRCYVFEVQNNLWTEVSQVSAPNLLHAGGIGRNCAISGDTVVFGAPSDDLAGPGLVNAGSAYVYRRALDGDWNFEQKLKAAVPFDEDQFGRSVGLEGDLVVIGANGLDAAGAEAGGAYVFQRTGVTWTQQTELFASDASDDDEFGRSAWIADGRVIVGAPYANGAGGGPGGNLGSGSAYVFDLTPPPATGYCTAGTSASGCTATLSAVGSASATAPSGFVVTARGVEGQKDGLFFFGTSGKQANPWGSGTSFQCVVPPVKRGSLQNGSGTTGACDGLLAEDLNAMWCPTCPKPHRNPGAGALAQVQLWYRDPLNTSNQTTSLSDALEFWVGP